MIKNQKFAHSKFYLSYNYISEIVLKKDDSIISD